MTSVNSTFSSSLRQGADGARQTVESVTERISGQADSMRAEVESLDQRVREVSRSHPLLALGTAVALGYMVGRLVSRR